MASSVSATFKDDKRAKFYISTVHALCEITDQVAISTVFAPRAERILKHIEDFIAADPDCAADIWDNLSIAHNKLIALFAKVSITSSRAASIVNDCNQRAPQTQKPRKNELKLNVAKGGYDQRKQQSTDSFAFPKVVGQNFAPKFDGHPLSQTNLFRQFSNRLAFDGKCEDHSKIRQSIVEQLEKLPHLHRRSTIKEWHKFRDQAYKFILCSNAFPNLSQAMLLHLVHRLPEEERQCFVFTQQAKSLNNFLFFLDSIINERESQFRKSMESTSVLSTPFRVHSALESVTVYQQISSNQENSEIENNRTRDMKCNFCEGNHSNRNCALRDENEKGGHVASHPINEVSNEEQSFDRIDKKNSKTYYFAESVEGDESVKPIADLFAGATNRRTRPYILNPRLYARADPYSPPVIVRIVAIQTPTFPF